MKGNDSNTSSSSSERYRYERLTWPEVDQAAEEGRVILLPVGAIEQHGHHLPLDVDVKLSHSVCLEVGRRMPDEVLIMPPVTYGYCYHVMDFPGTININMQHFVNYCLDITMSLAYHGFKRIVLVNGHGSNAHLLEAVARQTIVQTDAVCTAFSWWDMAREAFLKVRESQFPGGCAHACELETSVYLYLDAEGVRKEQIRDELPSYLQESSDWYALDLFGGEPTSPVNWTSTYTETGVIGQPSLARAEKGHIAFHGAVEKICGFVKQFRSWSSPVRRDHHATPPSTNFLRKSH